MRRANDLPRSRPGSRINGRVVLIALGLLFFLVVVFGRAIASFYVDALWHQSLGRSDVFWGQIGAKATLFFLFFLVFLVLSGLNLYWPTAPPRPSSLPTCTPTSNASTRCSGNV